MLYFTSLKLNYILLSLVFPSIATSVLTSENETDKLALIALKGHLVYDPNGKGKALTSWNESINFCKWQGVICGHKHQRVTTLRMSSLELAGSISSSIGNLTFLKELTLSDNKLTGNIPREVGRLRRLQLLNLTNNNLQGPFPLELTNCSSLKVINLNFNNLTGEVPSQLGNLHQLVRLSLASNSLTGVIPASLGNLSSLVHLSLGYNHLVGSIPETIGNPLRLSVLIMGQNNLSGSIPSSLYNLSSLQYFFVADNNLSGSLPSDLGIALPNLVKLYLGLNQFTGTIPPTISNISSLQRLDLAGNGFSGSVPNNLGKLQNLHDLTIDYNSLGKGKFGDLAFLSSLSNCSKLELLAINENNFGGLLPDAIGNFSSQLQGLYMGGNQISGWIPEGIGNLASLIALDLRTNSFRGAIPASIGNLQQLGRLLLFENNIDGRIPSFFGNLTQLFDLELYSNKFKGAIPSSLSNCTLLQSLDLSKNDLSGSIPEQSFGHWKSLISLDISYNSLSGHLPSDICNSSHLTVLKANENNFSGEIPSELGQCSDLTLLQMESNSFSGSIPLPLTFLKALEGLDLSRNNFSGLIPDGFRDLPNLKQLNLAFNDLEGEVPIGGVFGNASAFSVKGNHNLCGGIPELHLPVCSNKQPRKKRKVPHKKVIIASSISVLLMSAITIALVVFWWRRKPRSQQEPPTFATELHAVLRVSYKDLFQATGGFASSNLIGAGKFGSVYKGFLQQHEKPVAVKVLNRHQCGALKSFISECMALSKVRHRNLIKIITSCSSLDYSGNEFLALVLDFMPNGNLESWLYVDEENRSRKLDLTKRLSIAIDVANALDYLHNDCETPIVHCDIKPSNVLLDEDMVAHVGDFGLAKILSGTDETFSRDRSSSSTIKGTIGYVSPEYGLGGLVSPEGDIYSYGILVLEMITGKRPTDVIFNAGFSLRQFCMKALPERVLDIADSSLFEQSDRESYSSNANNNCWREGKLLECLVSVVGIGVSCTAEVPSERMHIKEVIKELHAAKDKLLQR